MRVVTTCTKQSLADYGHRWLESRKNWPADTDFQFYTEGFEVDCPGKDFRDMPTFAEWKLKHARYRSPGWKWNVVGYAHKVFAAADALRDYRGIGVWLDADCVTYKPVPEGLIESQLNGAYLAHYARPGLYTETGLWIMDCSHPEHVNFLDAWCNWYLSERFKQLPAWHDCMYLDATIRAFGDKIKTQDLSGEHGKVMHPMAVTELGRYIDHCKGPRKELGHSPENKFRAAA